MVESLEEKAEGVSCDAIIKIGAETLRAGACIVNRFVRFNSATLLRLKSTIDCQERSRLTNVFDVTNDAIVYCVARFIEFAVVMPVHIAIGVKVFADDRADDVRTTVDCEIGG